MTARCPNNPDHNRFITVAHISQDWLVDAEGNFIDVIKDLEIVADVSVENIWVCADCGAEAHHG